MKNNFFIKIFFFLFLTSNLCATNLEISSSEVKLDKKESKIILKGSVEATDENNNILKDFHYVPLWVKCMPFIAMIVGFFVSYFLYFK